jgi:RNA polymerase sigma-70 factor (ECF subfamily)
MNLRPEDLDPSLLTRASLLGRIRDWDDSPSWAEFHRIYFSLVYSNCRRRGLNHSEAEEVAQDVFQCVAESIHEFAPQAKCGGFRRWLLNLIRWRVIDHHRQPNTLGPGSRSSWVQLEKAGPILIENLPDPSIVEEEIQKIDWQTVVLESAMATIAKKVSAKRFQAFELYTRRQWSPAQIARELGMSPAVVYVTCHRLTRKLKKEVARLTQRVT